MDSNGDVLYVHGRHTVFRWHFTTQVAHWWQRLTGQVHLVIILTHINTPIEEPPGKMGFSHNIHLFQPLMWVCACYLACYERKLICRSQVIIKIIIICSPSPLITTHSNGGWMALEDRGLDELANQLFNCGCSVTSLVGMEGPKASSGDWAVTSRTTPDDNVDPSHIPGEDTSGIGSSLELFRAAVQGERRLTVPLSRAVLYQRQTTWEHHLCTPACCRDEDDDEEQSRAMTLCLEHWTYSWGDPRAQPSQPSCDLD